MKFTSTINNDIRTEMVKSCVSQLGLINQYQKKYKTIKISPSPINKAIKNTNSTQNLLKNFIYLPT